MYTKQHIIDLYKKELLDDLSSQKKQNDIEISKLLTTTNVQSFTSGVGMKSGRKVNYKKTRVVENGKNVDEVKKSEPYLKRISKRTDLQQQIDNIDAFDFNEQFDTDFEKFKQMYIKELQSELVESEKWLENKHNSLNLSIQNDLHKSIIAKNRKDYDSLFFKVEDLKEQLQSMPVENVLKYMYDNLNHAYNVRLDEQKKNIMNLEKILTSVSVKNRAFVSTKMQQQMDAVYQRERSIKMEEKHIERNADKGYRYFLKHVGYFPDYLKKNLEKMPCNRGYRFNGINFYGNLPDDNTGVTVLFEKKKKELFIHEYKGDVYTLKKQIVIGRDSRNRLRKQTVTIKTEICKNVYKQHPCMQKSDKKLNKITFKKEKAVKPIQFAKVNRVQNNVWGKNMKAIKEDKEFELSEEVIRQQAERHEKERLLREQIMKKNEEKDSNRLVAYFGPDDEYFGSDCEEEW